MNDEQATDLLTEYKHLSDLIRDKVEYLEKLETVVNQSQDRIAEDNDNLNYIFESKALIILRREIEKNCN